MKHIIIAVLAASLAAPSMAFAQSSTGTANEAATTDSGDTSFWTGAWMRDFFTDRSMTTVKPSAEALQAFAKMTPENQAKLKTACQGTYDRKYSDICEAALM
jgi:hypothetical protein